MNIQPPPPGGGPSMIVAKGAALYHMMGPLLPSPDCAPKFAQLYLLDNDMDEVNQQG